MALSDNQYNQLNIMECNYQQLFPEMWILVKQQLVSTFIYENMKKQ